MTYPKGKKKNKLLLVLTTWFSLSGVVVANNANDATRPSSLSSSTTTTTCQEENGWWKDTSCPWQVDGECDQSWSQECQSGDCFDCDPLQAFHYNCPACIAANGWWCPGDAVCRSRPVDESFYTLASARGNHSATNANDNDHVTNANTTSTRFVSSCPTTQDWKQSCDPIHDDNVFTDPLYDSMKWMYDMIHVEPVWRQGITGQGVHVRFNDEDGVDANHAEFANRFLVNLSCANYMPPVADPTTTTTTTTTTNNNEEQVTILRDHGTGCASVLAAGHDNNVCAVGIAPSVTLSACTLFHPLVNNQGAIALVDHVQNVDISSNSWGPFPCQPLDENDNDNRQHRLLVQGQCIFHYDHDLSPCRICNDDDDGGGGGELNDNKDDQPTSMMMMNLSNPFCRNSIIHHCTNFYEQDPIACAEYLDLFVDCQYHALSPQEHQLFVKAITQGRNGKGVIYVFPAGNEREYGSDANLDGFVNSRFTIAVAAVDKQRKKTRYSTPGSPVLLSAPGGDVEYISNNIVAKPGGVGCHDIGVGTSFATPVVAGVVALMLEVRPDLTWRDVQGILVATAQPNGTQGDDSWSTNGVGLNHSYHFGFGLVDAAAGVALAQNWESWGPEQQIMVSNANISLKILDDPTQSTLSTIIVPDNYTDFVMESVVVYLDINHGSRGDLAITLTSPSGTQSLLAPSKRPENAQLRGQEHWKLMTVRNWGESPVGNWTLKLVDESPGTLEPCADFEFDYYFASEDDDSLYYVNCDIFESTAKCVDGEVSDDIANQLVVDNGEGPITAAEACCACGGGVQVANVSPVLESWSLIVYGHFTTTGSGGLQV